MPWEVPEHTLLCQRTCTLGSVGKKKHFVVGMAPQVAEGPHHADLILSWVNQMAGLRKDDLKTGRPGSAEIVNPRPRHQDPQGGQQGALSVKPLSFCRGL